MNQQENPMPTDDDFARMESRLFTTIAVSEKKKVTQRRVIAGAGALLIVAGGLTTWQLSETEPKRPEIAYCYQVASATSQHIQVQKAAAPSATHTAPGTPLAPLTASQLALGECASLWANGTLSAATTASSSGGAIPASGEQLPSLEACLLNEQVIAVFPRLTSDTSSATDFCSNLGLKPAP